MQPDTRFWALAVLLAALVMGSRAAAAFDAAATPAPGAKPALAYDEIARVIPPGATPPPPGSFAEDAAAIAALPPLVVPKESELRLGALKAASLVPGIAGALLARVVEAAELARWKADRDNQNAAYETGKSARQKTGVLVKYAYLGVWKRIDFSPAFATVLKPDEGLMMMIDGDKKSYHLTRTAAGVETYSVESGRARVIAPAIASGPTVEELPPLASAGVPSRGYRTSGSIDVAMSTFLCTTGTHHVVETEYVADVADPEYDAQSDFTNTKPLIGACGLSGAVSHNRPGRLVLYRAITVDSGTPNAFSVVVERGNVRVLDERDAALFAAPPDYKEAP